MREVARAIGQDARFGTRLLMRDRGFALTAMLVLGFGIGVNNMLFTILRAHTIRGLPIDRPDHVLYISSFDHQTPDRGVSFLELRDLRAQTKSLSGIAAYSASAVAVADENRAPDRVDAAYATANAFAVLGIQPALGRTFDDAEDHPAAVPVVVLGSGIWRSRYAADPSILGRTIVVNGVPSTVIGVMPPRSGFPSTADLWLPLGKLPALANQGRNARTLRVFGRLHDGVREADARAEIESVVARLADEFPDTSRGNRARVVPINQRLLGRLSDPAWMAFMAFGCLALFVSCMNVANLMLAHAVNRAREIAVRTSLGATRLRVIRQLLTESAIVAVLGGLLGVAASFGGLRLFAIAIPANTLPYWFDYQMDAAVVAALGIVAVATVFIFGVVPALHASKADVNRVLRGGGRGIVHVSRSRRWSSTFTALELGVTVVMLSYLVADLRSPRYDVASDPVVDTRAVLTGNVTLPAESYGTPDRRRDFYARLQAAVRGLPGVSSVSMANLVPRRGAVTQKVEVEGRPLGAGVEAPSIGTVAIAPGFFETLALPLERGRDIAPPDAQPGATNIVVNTRFVELFLPDRDPIGSHIRFVPANPAAQTNGWLTIVGVAPQINHRAPHEAVAYLPFDGAPPATASVLLRTTDEQSVMTERLRESLRRLDPNLPIYRILTMTQVIEEQTWNGRVASGIVRWITIVAFLFCVVGLYAVTAHAVAQRTSEIGVRMALGARPFHVRLMILKRAALHVVLGLAVGVAGTLSWRAAFGSGLEDQFLQPAVLGPIMLLLAGAMLVACWLPARRAVRLDPMSALRSE
jgi:putative ABC transport system permease protein